jgi:hypothetical protein
MRASALVAIVAAAVVSVLPAQQPPPRVVTFLPTGVDLAEASPTIGGQFDSLLRASLSARQFTVVDGGPAVAAWLRVRDSLGGFYHRKTGRRLEPNLRSAARAALGATGAELLLIPRLVVVDAWIANYKAEWDGAQRRMELIVGGRTAALTLAAEVRDSSGDAVASLRSGFNTVARQKGGELVAMTLEEVFGDRKRMRECTDRLADSMPGVPRKPPPAVRREERPIP